MIERSATFSDDMKYRYWLKILWEHSKPAVNFLMLNPSTADEMQNDPTVERCCKRAKEMGYGSVVVTNIFALRSTDPQGLYALLKATGDPQSIVGQANNRHIYKAAMQCDITVCGWGQHGRLCERYSAVIDLLQGLELHYLKLPKDGQPVHPLYLAYSLKPQLWKGVTVTE